MPMPLVAFALLGAGLLLLYYSVRRLRTLQGKRVVYRTILVALACGGVYLTITGVINVGMELRLTPEEIAEVEQRSEPN